MEFDFAPLLEALPLPVMVRSQLGAVTNQLWQEQQPTTSTDWDFHHEQLTGILSDWEIIIAQHKLHQALSQQQVNQAQLERMKDEFLSCITHELRSPLTVVLGMTEILERQLCHQLTDRQRHYLKTIYRSGHRLASVINTMVDVTQAESGQLKLHLTVIKIRSLCEQVIQQLHHQELPHHPTIELTIAPDLDTIVADPSRLQQMLGHLLHNACRFTPKDQVPQVGIRVEAWESWVAFTVWDRGIGIADADQSLIFQKFQQLESPRTRQFDGTGLGLILTRQLARLHGGDVTFRSQLGVGSEFTLLLPPTPPSHPCRQLVLVVDTNPKQITTIVDTVTAAGFFPVIARSGLEALEKARQLRPSCIFMNYDLPILGGKEIYCLLQQDPHLKTIPVKLYHATAIDRIEISNFLPDRGHKIFCVGCADWSETHNLPFRCMTLDDMEQAELLAPLWKPAVIIVGEFPMLSAIYENGHLSQIPIVVKQLENELFNHLKLVACTDRELLATLNQLLGITHQFENGQN
ncbi:MAG: hypothetical protein CV045_04900 [Cyanobacteria bacterium M5B4]|nr:MAG: hypothetical protein CV045_04900 [Cyanobacteria bacterium M5B4]